MNGFEIQHILDLIDGSINVNMDAVRLDILKYLNDHGDELLDAIDRDGYGTIPTQYGPVKITKDDLKVDFA